MALQIVRKRVVKRLTPQSTATGWVNMVDAGGGVYPLIEGGVWTFTVTARDCAGLTVMNWGDWGAATNYAVAETRDPKNLTLTVAIDLKANSRIVVRTYDPTSTTEVIMTAEKQSPPPLP